MNKLISAAVCVCMLSGCVMGPKYEKPQAELPEPKAVQEDIDPYVNPNWWEMFQDPALNSLVQEALENNRDLQAALARVEEAQAQFRVTRADSLPKADISGNASYGTPAALTGGYVESPVQSYTVGPTVSFEIDIWGKQRRLNEAAKARYFSTAAARDLTRLVLTANVVSTYFLMLTLDSQLEIAKDTVTADEDTVRSYRNRYKAGFVSELDLRRIEAELNSVQATEKDLERQLSESQTALAVLVGRSPKEIVEGKIQRGRQLEQVILIPEIPEGIPSKVLEKRPDVKQAEEELIAANAEVGAAKASYFPNITLTGNAGYASDSLSNMIGSNTGFWGLAGGLVAPIFEGGKIKAQNKAAKAAYKEQLANYEMTVENAFKDVYDALVANRTTREVFTATRNQEQNMQRSYQITSDRYNAGLIDMTDLLDIKRTLLDARMNLASARYSQLNAIVNLSKALGGGWNEANFEDQSHKPKEQKENK